MKTALELRPIKNNLDSQQGAVRNYPQFLSTCYHFPSWNEGGNGYLFVSHDEMLGRKSMRFFVLDHPMTITTPHKSSLDRYMMVYVYINTVNFQRTTKCQKFSKTNTSGFFYSSSVSVWLILQPELESMLSCMYGSVVASYWWFWISFIGDSFSFFFGLIRWSDEYHTIPKSAAVYVIYLEIL